LSDGVSRTLFEEFAAHRRAERGDEETGWVLLGLREQDEAIALATLPAGTLRDAGVAHVRFNSDGQALASRMVRQLDRRLTILGVVHTHPGSLRHPSGGDFRGDIQWVPQLRGGEGVFGIGTADGDGDGSHESFAMKPQAHVQRLGALRLSWYSLPAHAQRYRPLPVDLTLGPDLARPLHDVWPILETYAGQLDRLHRQQAGVTFDVLALERGKALAVNIPLAESGRRIRVLLDGSQVRYYLERGQEVLEADCREPSVERGVYLLLAELSVRN
jgi:hypothetical protein